MSKQGFSVKTQPKKGLSKSSTQRHATCAFSCTRFEGGDKGKQLTTHSGAVWIEARRLGALALPQLALLSTAGEPGKALEGHVLGGSTCGLYLLKVFFAGGEGLREAVYMRVPFSEGTPFVWF